MQNTEWIKMKRDEFESLMEDRSCLIEAAQSVVDNWGDARPNEADEMVSKLKKIIEVVNDG